MTVRTRFAPSPTGYLHVGGARTALYCWLFARKHQGKFILRIEDTDRERSTQESVDAILQGMSWLGLDSDEGPFYQTQRFERYEEVIQQLLADGKAYRCCCSRERLDALREKQMADKQKPRYDGHCRDKNITADQDHVIRFRNPLDGDVVIDDQVKGTIKISNRELDDLIIARTDGTPTYNFTVVVDDWDMNVTHVVRGDDHINNTPRQINILQALGAKVPVYAHLPMILGDDGKRLSKRHGAVSVMQFREDGYLPEALLNYLVRLGWSHGDQEVFSREEMINLFDLKAINKSAAAFNTKKLVWMNQQYIKNSPLENVVTELAWHMQRQGIDVSQGPELSDIVLALRERSKTLLEMVEKSRCFYIQQVVYDADAAQKHLTATAAPALKLLRDQLVGLDEWQDESIQQVFNSVLEQLQLKMPKLAQPVRIALTGNTISPAINVTIRLVGKEQVISRLDAALLSLEQG